MSDTVRTSYRTLSEDEKAAMLAVKAAGQSFIDVITENAIAGREAALARTNAEQAVMWAVKGITG